MTKLKFVKMWTCAQCKEPLGRRCTKCLKHPDRKPVMQEWYAAPVPVRKCECRLSALVQCAREECRTGLNSAPGKRGARWVNWTNTRSGMYRHENVYCCRPCSLAVLSASRKTKVKVPCSWCGKMVERKVSEAKNLAHAFCDRSEYFMWFRTEVERAREAKRAASAARASFFCARCNDVNEHVMAGRQGTCAGCGGVNPEPGTSAISFRETQFLSRLARKP